MEMPASGSDTVQVVLQDERGHEVRRELTVQLQQ